MLHQSKEKIRSGGRKGQAKRTREMRQRRRIAVERNLGALGKASVARLAGVTGRSPAVVRAALKGPEDKPLVLKTRRVREEQES